MDSENNAMLMAPRETEEAPPAAGEMTQTMSRWAMQFHVAFRL